MIFRNSCIRLLFLLLIILLLSACSTTIFRSEPESPQSGLSIGRIELNIEGFSELPFPVAGRFTELTGIVLTFEKSDGEEFTLSTRRGIFYFNESIDSDYVRLKKIDYKKTRDDNWISFSAEFDGGARKLIPEPGKVLNLGTIEWNIFQDASKSWSLKNGKHSDIQSWFSAEYPESGWLKSEWKKALLFSKSISIRWRWQCEYR